MAVTAAMLADLRRMVNEPDDSNGYDDDTLTAILDDYPLLDERGEEPYTWDISTTPPSQDANTDWVARYDLHAAAGRIWEEKATGNAHLYDFSADGGRYNRSQIFEQALRMARYHNARRAPKTIRAFTWPPPTGNNRELVANLAEPD